MGIIGHAANAAIDSTQHAVTGVTDTVLAKPDLAAMHSYAAAADPQNISYRERLGNINETAKTADNILNIIADPKKLLGIVVLIAVVVLLLWLFKDNIAKLWDSTLGKFFKRASDKKDTENSLAALGFGKEDVDEIKDNYPTLTQAQAERIATVFEGCFGAWNDDEATAEKLLKDIKGDINWQMVITAFGTPTIKRVFGSGRPYDLPSAITSFMPEKQDDFRAILKRNGVQYPQF